METLALAVIIIFLLITLLMYAVNLGDMFDAKRDWHTCRDRFYASDSVDDAADLLAAIEVYEDTLDAMRGIWKWPWLALVALWMYTEDLRMRIWGAD